MFVNNFATSRAKRAALLKPPKPLNLPLFPASCHQPRETRGPIETRPFLKVLTPYQSGATSRAKRAALLKRRGSENTKSLSRICHQPRETRGPIETTRCSGGSEHSENRTCHQPRETRGPIETSEGALLQSNAFLRHQPRETRGPIETGIDVAAVMCGDQAATSRAKRAALLKLARRIVDPHTVHFAATSRAKRAALLKPPTSALRLRLD